MQVTETLAVVPELPWDAIRIHERQIITNSVAVAASFDKQHRNVFRDANALKSERIGKFWEANFSLTTYIDSRGRTQQIYEMTKDGFTLLVMGYTGEKAMRFKVAYINAFDAMAARLSRDEGNRIARAERAYFARYPKDKETLRRALVGEPYWYIGERVGRCAGTVGKAIRRMIEWGFIEAQRLVTARIGMTAHRRWLRAHRRQIPLF